jgi:hypothetical protein
MLRIASTSTVIVLFMTQFLATANPLPQLPPSAGASIQEDTGQVSISERPDANTTATNFAIEATIFTGVPGPKSCRGGIMTTLSVPRPDGLGLRTGARCYNLPAVAGCGNFVANKDDGCEARLFAEPACVGFVNLAVFMPETRPVGGAWRSLSVECGIPAPDPASLGAPPLQGMISNVKRPQKD